MARLAVSVVQVAADLDPAANRRRLGDVVTGPGLVVLPEAYARDFGRAGSDVSSYAEDLDGPFVDALTDVARTTGATVVAGMFERSADPTRPYNTLVVVNGSGVRASYRKTHLYDSFGHRESAVLSAGPPEPVVIDVAGVTVGLMTCYDLRFPEMGRLLVDAGAELVVVPAAWVAGERKVRHWRTLLAARAIENLVYVAAAGQPGPRYSGRSTILDPRGDVLAEASDEEAQVLRQVVDTDVVYAARRENPSLANRRLVVRREGGQRPV